MEPTTTPRTRKPGRPRGSKTDPRIKAATKARRSPRAPSAAGEAPTGPVPDPTETPLDDIAAAAVPDPRPSTGGRPSTDERGRNRMAESLSTAYEGFGGILQAGAAVFAGIAPGAASRINAVGHELRANADRCGLALARWADTNPRVKEWLSGLATGSGALLVLAAHAPIIAAAAGRADIAPIVGAAADMATGQPSPMADLFGAFLGNFMPGTADDPAQPPAAAAAA